MPSARPAIADTDITRARMESSRNNEATGEVKDDLSALAWVQEELRRSLDAAHKALRRFVKEAESLAGSDVDVVDPSVLRTARQQIHQGVGALELVGLPAAATVLRAGLGAGESHPQAATLWKLAAGVFEAQAHGLLASDVFVKRVASRLLAQLRIVERGEGDVSERLAQDLLFFCAQAASPGAGKAAPRLAAVRQVYGLVSHHPVDYATSALGRYDPAWVAQARKRVSAAKESWSAVAGGELHRMSGLTEQFSLVGDSLKRLFPQGEAMASELQHAVSTTQQGAAAPGTALAMEVATGLLYVDAALEDADFDSADQGQRIQRLAQRIAAVRQGAAPEPLEGWMEDLYRRVSDRQTMGSVVQELRHSLSEAEKLIDQFFRNPADRNVLIPVPNQLASMRGVLSVLGMDQASTALLRMRDEVEGMIQTEVDPQRVAQAGVFDRLAGNLGALGFLIDMLSVQPQLAKSLFVYDAAAGTLNPSMGRAAQRAVGVPAGDTLTLVEPRLIEHAQMLAFSAVREDVSLADVSRDLAKLSVEAKAADQPALSAAVTQAQEAIEHAHGAGDIASARGQLSEALVDFVATASGPVGLDSRPAPLAPVSAPAPLRVTPPAPATMELAEDDEMREIFLEEAREVVQGAQAACRHLAGSPDDLEQLTTVRRAYHTLKGSSRMVGLKAFGDAAWACEQLYNARLADQQPADDALRQFTTWSLDYLSGWVEDIATRRDGARDPKIVESAALALRDPAAAAATRAAGGAHAAAPAVAAPVLPPPVVEAPVAQPMALGMPPDLPSAHDLDFTLPPAAPAAAPLQTLSFELDLSKFDAPPPAATPALGVDPTSPSMFALFDDPVTP